VAVLKVPSCTTEITIIRIDELMISGMPDRNDRGMTLENSGIIFHKKWDKKVTLE
jgi:hypothetical protein